MGACRNTLIVVAVVVLMASYYFRLPYIGPEVNKTASFGSHPALENQPGAEPGVMIVGNFPTKVGWSEDAKPIAPKDFKVTLFAKTEHGRWLLQLPNGDVLVAESRTVVPEVNPTWEQHFTRYFLGKADNAGLSPNRIILLRDADADGKAEFSSVYLKDLRQPLGMAVHSGYLYVSCTDAVLRFPFIEGATSLDRSTGERIATLPAGGYNNHWTRNLFIQNNKLYVSVGSASNIAEFGIDEESRRACVLEMDLDGSNQRVYASGIRNPLYRSDSGNLTLALPPPFRSHSMKPIRASKVRLGLDTHPVSGLWTVVNERDMLGDDLVPDYLTRVRNDDFYGWPWWFWKDHVDTRVTDPKPSKGPTSAPDYALGPHTASLGLAFYKHTSFPKKYHNGAFIGQHGSWNRRSPSGYAVIFVPFNGLPASEAPEDFLTGFLASKTDVKVYGRPVGVHVLKDGSLLVADDTGSRVWHVSYKGRK